MTRLPDINIETDPIPEGCYLHEGLHLMKHAKNRKIPYGTATKTLRGKNSNGNHHTRYVTVGIIVRLEDRERMDAAIKARKEKNAK